MKRYAVVFLFFTVLLVGCGGNEAEVSGKITWKETPLNAGSITFIKSGGTAGSTFPISKEGTFSAKGLAPGKYTVTISTPNMAPPVVGAPPAPGKKATVEKATPPVQVDGKYAKAESSNLEYDLTAGSQNITISLPK